MSGYKVMQLPVFDAIKSMTADEFADLQRTCEFNRNFPGWRSLGKRLIKSKRVKAYLVAKPA